MQSDYLRENKALGANDEPMPSKGNYVYAGGMVGESESRVHFDVRCLMSVSGGSGGRQFCV